MNSGLTIIAEQNDDKRKSEKGFDHFAEQFDKVKTVGDVKRLLAGIPNETPVRYSFCSTRHDYIVFVDSDGNAKRIDNARDRKAFFSFEVPIQ